MLEVLPVHVQPHAVDVVCGVCCMFAFGLLDETFDVANPTLRSVPVSRSAAPCPVTVSARECCHGARSARGSVSTASVQLVARRTSTCSLESSLTRRTKVCIPVSVPHPEVMIFCCCCPRQSWFSIYLNCLIAISCVSRVLTFFLVIVVFSVK